MATLPISNSQSQSTTQSPQSNVQSLGSTAQSGSVQPGTTSSLLNSGTGSVALHPTALPSIGLGTAQTAATTTSPVTTKPAHHTNPVFFGLALALFIVAAVLYWLAGRAEKSNLH